MAKYILEKIKIEGILADLLAKSDSDNVAVVYQGTTTSLTSALAGIITQIAALPTDTDVSGAISTAIDGLIGGAPGTYDTLKEIADFIASHQDVVTALNAAIGSKVDKVAGKGLSTEDFTTTLKAKLDSMVGVTSTEKNEWSAKANTTVATQSANGLMSAGDKKRLDGLRGIKYGTTAPADLQDGEMFVRVVQ